LKGREQARFFFQFLKLNLAHVVFAMDNIPILHSRVKYRDFRHAHLCRQG